MADNDRGLTTKAVLQLPQAAHPDRCVEDPDTIPSAQYVAPQRKEFVALPLPWFQVCRSLSNVY